MTTELSLGPEDFVDVDDLYGTDCNATTKTKPQTKSSDYEAGRAQAIKNKKMLVQELVDSHDALLGGRERARMAYVSDVLAGSVNYCEELHVRDGNLLVAWCRYTDGKGVTYRTRVPYDILKFYGLV